MMMAPSPKTMARYSVIFDCIILIGKCVSLFLFLFFSLLFFVFPLCLTFCTSGIKEPNETCMKTTILSSFMLATFILFAILIISLWMTCTKLRYRSKDSGLYNAYINHKGQIDWIRISRHNRHIWTRRFFSFFNFNWTITQGNVEQIIFNFLLLWLSLNLNFSICSDRLGFGFVLNEVRKNQHTIFAFC